MSGQSAIEWTEATWNPVTGCSKVSPGCAHCYAESYTERMAGQRGWIAEHRPWTPANAAHNVRLHPDRLDAPVRWKRPRMVFVNSMSDLFHEQVPSTFIYDVFNAMRDAPQHTFQILTKRPERMQAELRGLPLREFWPHVWLGTSIENRRFVDRADWLRLIDCAVRFISAEPLLGPLAPERMFCSTCSMEGPDDECDECEGIGDWWFDGGLRLDDIHWLIVGGESGPKHRPIKADWVRDLRDLATDYETAFFFKQWGGRTPKSGGRLLDGRTWDEFPRQKVAV